MPTQVALSLDVAESLAARLRSELFLRLLGRDALFFDRVRTGQMMSWLGQDVEVLQVGGLCGGWDCVGGPACMCAGLGQLFRPARATDIAGEFCMNNRSARVRKPSYQPRAALLLSALPRFALKPHLAHRHARARTHARPCRSPQSTIAKLLGARGVRSAFETVGIIIMLFTLSPLLAAVLLVTAPLLTPLVMGLTRRIGGASKTAQVGPVGAAQAGFYSSMDRAVNSADGISYQRRWAL